MMACSSLPGEPSPDTLICAHPSDFRKSRALAAFPGWSSKVCRARRLCLLACTVPARLLPKQSRDDRHESVCFTLWAPASGSRTYQPNSPSP